MVFLSSDAMPSVQHITIPSLEEIPVDREFPDVFPMTCLACHWTGMWGSPLNYNLAWHPSPGDHMR
jgi:cytochrome c5